MKYIDAEKLSTQIEKIFPDSSDERTVEGFEYALDKVKAIIDYLQQEQPEVDLEKELENYAKENPMEDAGSYRNLINIAHHFYRLGLKTRK